MNIRETSDKLLDMDMPYHGIPTPAGEDPGRTFALFKHTCKTGIKLTEDSFYRRVKAQNPLFSKADFERRSHVGEDFTGYNIHIDEDVSISLSYNRRTMAMMVKLTSKDDDTLNEGEYCYLITLGSVRSSPQMDNDDRNMLFRIGVEMFEKNGKPETMLRLMAKAFCWDRNLMSLIDNLPDA